ncbi:hypothetical protein Q7P36_001095 [Cladosporium allicinum]
MWSRPGFCSEVIQVKSARGGKSSARDVRPHRKRQREKQLLDSHNDIAIDMAISRHRIVTSSIVIPSSAPLVARNTATWATIEPRSLLRTPPLLADATDKMDLVKCNYSPLKKPQLLAAHLTTRALPAATRHPPPGRDLC